MDKQTAVEEQLKDEISRLQGQLFEVTRERNKLVKKAAHQSRVMGRQRGTIDQLRRKITAVEDKQHYVNVNKGIPKKKRIRR